MIPAENTSETPASDHSARAPFPPTRLSDAEYAVVNSAAHTELELVNSTICSGSGRYGGVLGASFRKSAEFFSESRRFARFLTAHDSRIRIEEPGCIEFDQTTNRPRFVVGAPGQTFVRSFQVPESDCFCVWVREFAAPLVIVVILRTRDTKPEIAPRRFRRLFATSFVCREYSLRAALAEEIVKGVFDEPSAPAFKFLRAYASRRAKSAVWSEEDESEQGADEIRTASDRRSFPPSFAAQAIRTKVMASVRRTLQNILLAAFIEQRTFQTESHRQYFRNHQRWMFRSLAPDTRRRRGRLRGGGQAMYRSLYALLSPYLANFWRRMVDRAGFDPAFAYLIESPHHVAWIFAKTAGRFPGYYAALRRRLSGTSMMMAQMALKVIVAARIETGLFADAVYHRADGTPVYLCNKLAEIRTTSNPKDIRGVLRIISLPADHVYSIAFQLKFHDENLREQIPQMNRWRDDEKSIRAAAREFRNITGSRKRQHICHDMLVYIADTMRMNIPPDELEKVRNASNLAVALREARRIHEMVDAQRRGSELALAHGETATMPIPTLRGLKDLELFRLTTVAAVRDAGAEMSHCIATYAKNALAIADPPCWLLRDGSVCCQVTITLLDDGVAVPSVRQCYDSSNRVTAASRRFAMFVQSRLRVARRQPGFNNSIKEVIAAQKRQVAALAKNWACSGANDVMSMADVEALAKKWAISGANVVMPMEDDDVGF